MKSPSTHRQSRRGFTLIELLVVVAIIAILAAMGFGVGASAIKRAKTLTDRAAAVSLSQAIEGYFDEYSRLPVAGGETAIDSDDTLMNVLMAFGPHASTSSNSENPKGIRYYSGKSAKASSVEDAYGGLFYSGNSVQLFDAWKKTSGKRHYQVILDSDYNDEIDDPTGPNKVYNRRALVWSTGKDGESSPTETNEANRDDAYSWKD